MLVVSKTIVLGFGLAMFAGLSLTLRLAQLTAVRNEPKTSVSTVLVTINDELVSKAPTSAVTPALSPAVSLGSALINRGNRYTADRIASRVDRHTTSQESHCLGRSAVIGQRTKIQLVLVMPD